MNSDLIVMTFDGFGTASAVYKSLLSMPSSRVLGLDDAAIVTRGVDGKVERQHGSRIGKGIAGLLADSIFGSSGRSAHTGDSVKLDDEFVGAVLSALRRGGSALLLFLDVDSLSDSCQLLEALELFRGTVHQTTVHNRSSGLVRGIA